MKRGGGGSSAAPVLLLYAVNPAQINIFSVFVYNFSNQKLQFIRKWFMI
jgi:hypothetical protein